MNDSQDEKLVASIEDDPIAQQLQERATFIPLRHTDLRNKLVEVFAIGSDEADAFNQLCNHLQTIFHVEHLAILLQLEEVYSHLDPDSELMELQELDPRKRNWLTDNLIDRISSLLFSAHYKRLTREELERAIELGSQWGVRLDVDFEKFQQLEIFARGYRTVTVKRRRWQNFFLEETIELPEFQRLIMVFRMRGDANEDAKNRTDQSIDSSRVYLKTFKNIPETDLEILLPGSTVRLTKLDQARILLPTVSGSLITAYKLFRSILVLSVAITFSAIFGWVILIGVLIGYVIKTVLGYFRAKNKYQFGLTKSLYLKNLDNNLSVIYRILNEAEEQELCEAILGYTLLWKNNDLPSDGATSRDLDELAEKFLFDATGVNVDFEVHDALGKLARLGLAEVDSQGKWRATNIDQAIESLDQNWRKLFKAKTGIVVDAFEPPDQDLFTS